MIINFNSFLVANLGKSLSSEVVSSKFTIFWNFIFILWELHSMVLKQFQVINYLLPFFWWNVNFFYFLCFIIFFRFRSQSNFISCFISNQISCSFYSFSSNSFRSSFCSIYSCLCCSINWFFTLFITKFSGK